MSNEIRVPVTVPGANKAAQELRGVQQAAQGVGKAEEAAARSADKLTAANKRLGESSKTAARSFQALGRGGGAMGGLLGRVGGSLGSGQLGALGPIAAGAAVAGAALMKLADISNHAVERATALAKALIDTRNAVDAGQKQGGSNRLADFRENGQVLRRLVAAGVSNEQLQRMGGKHADGPEAVASLSGFSDFGKPRGRAAIALGVARGLKQMGVTGSLMEGMVSEERVANAIGQHGVNAGVQLEREMIGEQRGGGPISMDEWTQMKSRSRWDQRVHGLDLTGSAEGGARLARLGGAADPSAAASVYADRAAWLDPVNAALSEITKQQDQAIEQMKAAADAEFTVMEYLKDTFMPGGSFETQLRRAINDRARVSQSTGN